MRLVIAAALAFCVAPTGAVSGQLISVPPLTPGEVLLEIDAIGQIRLPADRVTLLATFQAQGSTPAEARRAIKALEARIVAAARGAGVREEDIDLDPPATRIGFIGNEAAGSEATGWTVFAPKEVARTVTSALEIRVRDPSHVERLREVLEGTAVTMVQGPTFVLSDDNEARRLARADALRRARGEAEAYARASGMRVVRLLRISERAPSDSARLAGVQDFMQMFSGRAAGKTPEVQVRAVVGVDFALAPK